MNQQLLLELHRRWSRNQGGFKIPSWLVVWIPDADVVTPQESGELFLVIDDHMPIIRLMDAEGRVYMAMRDQCQNNVCPRADMVLCSAESSIDRFVSQELRPILQSYNQ